MPGLLIVTSWLTFHSVCPWELASANSYLQHAWTVYNACQAAPAQAEALSEAVEALYIIWERVKNLVLENSLDNDDLNHVTRVCITVLTELEVLMGKYKSLHNGQGMWDKLRWSRENIDAVRRRLTSNVSSLRLSIPVL